MGVLGHSEIDHLLRTVSDGREGAFVGIGCPLAVSIETGL